MSRAPPDKAIHSISALFHGLMLPDPDHRPTCLGQRRVYATVAFDVRCEFRLPILDVALRGDAVLWATMPEASVHEDRDARAGKDDIGTDRTTAWEPNCQILPKPQASAMQHRTQRNLGPRIRPLVGLPHGGGGGSRGLGVRHAHTSTYRYSAPVLARMRGHLIPYQGCLENRGCSHHANSSGVERPRDLVLRLPFRVLLVRAGGPHRALARDTVVSSPTPCRSMAPRASTRGDILASTEKPYNLQAGAEEE